MDLDELQKKFDKRMKRKVYQERIIYIPPRTDNYCITYNHYNIKHSYKKYREGQGAVISPCVGL